MTEKLTDLDALRQRLLLKREVAQRLARNKLGAYKPYPKQAEFHAAGATKRERMLKAGNQEGKTLGAGFEVAMHLTGRYPDWWTGRRFASPIVCWASSVTALATRDNPQRMLLGRLGGEIGSNELGTGSIPHDCLILEDLTWARSVADAVDTCFVRHVTGGRSMVQFKSYEQGREKWQGPPVDVVWFDEEPPQDIYSEGLTRTNATGGIALLTYTPLLGMSEVTCLFLKNPTAERHVTSMTIMDAAHYSPEQREKVIASYPAHEREARVNGVPMMGSGRIFPLAKEAVSYEAMQFPAYFRKLGAIDFGWTHPTAAVWAAYDPDADTVYIYDAYRVREATPVVHAGAFRARGLWIPFAWPHDGNNETAAGKALADQYAAQGMNMLPESARYSDERANYVEPGLMDMLDRMQTGRLKVASHLLDWFEEFLMYHREDGKVVKEMDDLMSATRYLIMMLRHATTKSVKLMPELWKARLKKMGSKGRGSAQSA